MRLETGETGLVLILVVILLTVTSLISAHLMLQGILGQKIAHNFKTQIQERQEAENRLLGEEKKIEDNIKSSIARKVAFVPDHLGFGCSEGVEIYQVAVPPYYVYYAILKP